MYWILGCDGEALSGRTTVDEADVQYTGDAGLATWADVDGADVLLGSPSGEEGCDETEAGCPGSVRVLIGPGAVDANAEVVATCTYEDAPQARFVADLTGEGEPEIAAGQGVTHDALVFSGESCVVSPIAWMDVDAPMVAIGSIGSEHLVFGAPTLGDGAVFLLPGDRRGGSSQSGGALTAAFGDSMLGAGGLTADVDGDGLDDVVLTGSRIWVYTYAGGFERSSDLADAAGPGWSAQVGHALAAADIDGDGHLDLLAGDATNDTAVVIRGPLVGVLSPWSTVTGAGAFGADVAVLGDVNADDAPDLLFGAPEANDGKGGAWLLLGPLTSGTHGIGAPDRELVGIEADGEVGATVLGLGDTDGDGIADFALGAPGFGGMYLFRGAE